MKILILRFSSIGDIVLTTPAVRCLKQQLPESEVHFCTKRIYKSIVQHNPYIDQCLYLDTNLLDLIHQLRAERYDCVIDLHNNLRTRIIKAALGIRSYSLNKLNIRKWLYVQWKYNPIPSQHIVERYIATMHSLGIRNDGKGLDYFIPKAEWITSGQIPVTHRRGYVAYAIGGQHATKRLPPDRMIDLCRKINEPIILLGGPEDRAAGEIVRQAIGSHVIYNGCGLYTINQSASLVRQARVVFSHDTGLMHIAAALKKTVYSIWGSTTPQLGMYPYKTQFFALENKELSCRPCSKIGHSRCPLHHFRCMNYLPFDFELPLPTNQPDVPATHIA
ncbi:glycosyltransferase family 9 protein [Spirosoma harenae]